MDLKQYYSIELFHIHDIIRSSPDFSTERYAAAAERLVGLTRAMQALPDLEKVLEDTELFKQVNSWAYPKSSKLYAEALIEAYAKEDARMELIFWDEVLANLLPNLEEAESAEIKVLWDGGPDKFKVTVFQEQK